MKKHEERLAYALARVEPSDETGTGYHVWLRCVNEIADALYLHSESRAAEFIRRSHWGGDRKIES